MGFTRTDGQFFLSYKILETQNALKCEQYKSTALLIIKQLVN